MNKQSITFTEAFWELTNQELRYKKAKKFERALKKSRFPKTK